MKKYTCIWLILLMIFFTECLFSFNQKSKFSYLKKYNLTNLVVEKLSHQVLQWFNKSNIVGMVIGITDNKGNIWKGEFGYSNLKKKKLVNSNTLFCVQSLSKSFTALAVLIAVSEDILDLDTPISSYLPEFRVNSIYEKEPQQKITLRHLLSHRSGLTHEAPIGSNFDNSTDSFDLHISSISDTWLKYPVGYRIAYSNLGIDLAGYILQIKTKMRFTQYIQNKILKPMGMNNTQIDKTLITNQNNKSKGYGYFTDKPELLQTIPTTFPMIPSAGIYSTLDDMLKYLRFYINKSRARQGLLLKRDHINPLFEVAFPMPSQRSGYTLGLIKEAFNNTFSLSHGGGGFGFSSYMIVYPDLDLGLIILSNTRGNNIINQIKNLLDDIIKGEIGSTKPLLKHMDTSKLQPLDPQAERVLKILGIYDKTWIIKLVENNLLIGWDQENYYPLKTFTLNDQLICRFGRYSEIRFLKPFFNKKGSMVYFNRLHDNVIFRDFHMPLKSLDTPGPNKKEWNKYLGIYEIRKWDKNAVHTFNICLINGYLYLNWMRCNEYLPGLFFTYNAESLDFRSPIPTFRNIKLYKKK